MQKLSYTSFFRLVSILGSLGAFVAWA